MAPGLSVIKRKSFSRLYKVSYGAVSLKSLDSEFHVLAPQKEKDLSPNIFILDITNSFESDDNLRWWDGVYNCNMFVK